MLINKYNLSVAEFASKEESRYTLQAIRVGKDGTVATDGRLMVKVSLPKADGKNFPAIEGFTPAGEDFTPFLLSREAALDIQKQIPKRQTIPVLNNACVGQASESSGSQIVNIAVTDLEMTKVLKCRPVTGQFPNCDEVMPSGEPVAEITLNSEALAQLAKAAAAFTDDRHKSLKIKLYGKNRAVVMTAGNSETGQEWTGLLMPIGEGKDG